mgnify:CR=1 FL=1
MILFKISTITLLLWILTQTMMRSKAIRLGYKLHLIIAFIAGILLTISVFSCIGFIVAL